MSEPEIEHKTSPLRENIWCLKSVESDKLPVFLKQNVSFWLTFQVILQCRTWGFQFRSLTLTLQFDVLHFKPLTPADF